MKAAKSGSRFPLLFYRRTMDRIWHSTLLLGLVLGGTWVALQVIEIPVLHISNDIWLFVGAIVSLAICVFGFVARMLAYVQAHQTHLSVATPFLRMNISYRRIQAVHPVLIQQLFPKAESSWAQRSFLEPFYGKTAMLVELRGYPMNPALLKLFLPPQMFSPRSDGLVLLVADWMKFSTELDSFQGAWLQSQSGRSKGTIPGSLRTRR